MPTVRRGWVREVCAARNRLWGGGAVSETGTVLRGRFAGVDLDEVARVLEVEGVAAYEKSFDDLLGVLERRAEQL